MIILFLAILMNTTTQMGSIHDFQIKALNSEDLIHLSDFKGKKILMVNVASKCGFTYQYEGLEELYQKYKDQLVVIGVPCNQFLFQESGSEEKIATFCSTTYGVSFPMTQKIEVKGKGAHPIYKWLTSKELNGKDNYKVSWNFNKFLLDEEGNLIAHFPSNVKPMDDAITSLIEE
jgi:glutathione peroxidase